MGLKSVSITSNERKATAKHALDSKQRTAKKPGLPVPKTSLEKISSRPKASPQMPETSQSQVCIRFCFTTSIPESSSLYVAHK